MTQSESNYYTEDSDVTVTSAQHPAASLEDQVWRPGQAGPYERYVAGGAEGHGWLLYFVDRFMVLEVWLDGEWQFTRWLDCQPLTRVQGAVLEHLTAFGYDQVSGMLSLGCVTRAAYPGAPDSSASVHRAFMIPGLDRIFTHPPRVQLGAMPVAVSGGGTQYRGLGPNTRISGLQGRFTGQDQLSAGELSRLAGRHAQSWRGA